MSVPNKRIAARVSALVNATVVLLVLLLLFTAVNRHQTPSGFSGFLATRITIKNLIVATLFLAACKAVFCAFGLTTPSRTTPFWKELVKVTKACSVAAVFAWLFPLTSSSGAFTVRIIFYFLPTAIVACLFGRFVALICTDRLIRMLGDGRDLIIVGSGPRAAGLYERVRQPGHGYSRVLGFVDTPNGHIVPPDIRRQMLGGLEDLGDILMKQPVDEVIIALPAKSCYEKIQTAITTCESAGVEAKYLFDVFELSFAKPRFEQDENTPVVTLKVVQDGYRLLVKRGIDIGGAIAGLVIFGPLMLAIAVGVRLTSPGPALFTQERYGFRKRHFRMYKFRTMVCDAERLQADLESQNEAQGPVFKIRNDPRITPLGRILRKTSLDELPQLLNVLMGEMSLVGPRPLPKRDVSRFNDGSLMRRFSVKPGLTCLWQINGRSNTVFTQWIEQDLKYIDTWSLALDFEILAKTLPALLRCSGAV
jgi:exopolysaccharide biosynthesis polyprenyl glycosylphosphotransferase